ncbi:DNA-binding protein REB1 [Nakaseomyces bracarensis]|uniref:DNA-binding protein REB1 n=1 Tax=Nakaseomyces bracarensis TaxID=273131 RepID=A0ABR4NU49_9SACH
MGKRHKKEESGKLKHSSKSKKHSTENNKWLDWKLKDDDSNAVPEGMSIAAIQAVDEFKKKRKHNDSDKNSKKKKHKHKKHQAEKIKGKDKTDTEDFNVDPALSSLGAPFETGEDVDAHKEKENHQLEEEAAVSNNSSSGDSSSDIDEENFMDANSTLIPEPIEHQLAFVGSPKKDNSDKSSSDLNDIALKAYSHVGSHNKPAPIKGSSELDKAFVVKNFSDSVSLEPLSESINNHSGILSSSMQSAGRGFDEKEDELLDKYISEYQQLKNFNREQLCDRIWNNNGQRDEFWKNICKILPYRSRSSLYKHVRRRYHVFEQRGKWTKEEDEQLSQLCLEKEGQWSLIGKVMGRMPEDVRDRWRNYIKCGNKRASQKWTTEEEELLKQVITEMLADAVKHQKKSEAELDGIQDGILDEDDKHNQLITRGPKGKRISDNLGFTDVINWTVVSELMGGARSRIQCRYKWNKMIKDEAINKVKGISLPEKKWLINNLKEHQYTHQSHIDWESISKEQPGPGEWSALELRLCYEKSREPIKDIKNKTVTKICEEIIVHLETA